MKIAYRNQTLEEVLAGLRGVMALIAVASFALLFGFYEPPIRESIVFSVQTVVFLTFLGTSIVRLINAESKREYLYVNWYDVPALLALAAVVLGARQWFGDVEPYRVRHMAVAVYLMFEVTIKFFLLSVRLAASGRNPSRTLVVSFVVLIATGAVLLMLPKATPGRTALSPLDALFTSTSATCVTGLVVVNTAKDFTFMGQVVILVLIQLGALGIVVFGAVFALLLGQALTLRETVAMQDLLQHGDRQPHRSHDSVHLRRYDSDRSRRSDGSVWNVGRRRGLGSANAITLLLQHLPCDQCLLQRRFRSARDTVWSATTGNGRSTESSVP
jgi:hypothetical protein